MTSWHGKEGGEQAKEVGEVDEHAHLNEILENRNTTAARTEARCEAVLTRTMHGLPFINNLNEEINLLVKQMKE